MTDVPLHIADDFGPRSKDDWRALVERELGPGGLDKLRSTLGGALEVEPLYTASDLSPSARMRRGAREPRTAVWVQPSGLDAGAIATKAIDELMGGATGLVLDVDPDGPLGPPAELERALAPIELSAIELAFTDCVRPVELLTALRSIADRHSADRAQLGAFLGADPLGRIASGTRASEAWMTARTELASTAARVAAELPRARTITASSEPFHLAGANVVQELAYAIACGIDYLRALTDHGMSARDAAGQIAFRFALGTDFFVSIALLRAARAMWSKVARASGFDADGMHIHAVSSMRALTQRDPWVNLLRTTASTFSALVAGADAVTVTPFDAAIGAPDAKARRLARNTALILIEESHLLAVDDPAGGSWCLERLTGQLAERAWTELVDIERQGGMASALESGIVAERIASSRQIQEHEVATRKRPITGVSEFAHLEEDKLRRPSLQTRAARTSLAFPFEQLRDRSDRHLEIHGFRPTVFLASLGKIAEHNARTTWVDKLLAAGGIEADASDGYERVEDAVTAFSRWITVRAKQPGARVAAICSSDARYAADAADLARQLRAAGADLVLLAGKPGALEAQWRDAGVQEFVFVGCDVLAFLESLAARLEVAP